MSNPNEAFEKLARHVVFGGNTEVIDLHARENLAMETTAWVNTLGIEEQKIKIVWFGGEVARKDLAKEILHSEKFAKFWTGVLESYRKEYLSGGAK